MTVLFASSLRGAQRRGNPSSGASGEGLAHKAGKPQDEQRRKMDCHVAYGSSR
jgi:hypothetical protein